MTQTNPSEIQARLDTTFDQYAPIIGIISPPRCSSTAFARVFWQHPAIRYYAHEPFEVTYYLKQDVAAVTQKLDQPLDLTTQDGNIPFTRRTGLVIKDMPYQVGQQLPLFLSIVTKPLIFLIRDPRLNIASRMAKKEEVGDSPFFPQIESGWALLQEQIAFCRDSDMPYMVVDAAEFRNRPKPIFAKVFARLNLSFSPEMLHWQSHPEIQLDNLDGAHSHLYRHVLTSTEIEAEYEPIPPLESFPIEHGWRDHVAQCLHIYRDIRNDTHRIVN
jgi:hypothetical protein